MGTFHDVIRTTNNQKEQDEFPLNNGGLEEEKKEDIIKYRQFPDESLVVNHHQHHHYRSADMDGLRQQLSRNPDSLQSIVRENQSATHKTMANVSIQATNQKRSRSGGGVSGWIRLGANLCMFLLAAAFAAVYCIRCIHDEYITTIMDRAQRLDEDLMDEYTYYDRRCNLADLTALPEDAGGLVLDSDQNGVDHMMLHGAVMLPELLPQSMISELREFVVAKNDAVKGTAAEYPVSQGRRRISYGIEAAEHPAVSKALKTIHDSDRLRELLEGLVGRNPSLTEITAITAYYGSSDQAWHSDVKADGHAMKFGRTYSHSYSLFIPLQNTTGAMGATDICPGTHYCGDDLHELCEEYKIGMHEVRGEGIWRAGDAALLNQQIWHRGAAHIDKDAPERIIFIVSFIGRPTDTRQLARGTYFHMKWNMWGHTWQDLADSAISMAWPFNILRCLHLWKPNGRDWGYDLITASALRIANYQGGCEPEELHLLVNTLIRLKFPEWLFGTIDVENSEAWRIFIRETIDNTFNFMKQLNSIVLMLYFAVLLLVACVVQYRERSGVLCLARNVLRIIILYGTVLGILLYTMATVRTSTWAMDISSGHTLMRPFPNAESAWHKHDPTVSKGPTTLPYRQDVLVGTRMNSKTIGAYRYWMDFHPGNRRFRDSISRIGGSFYRSYEQGLPKAFPRHLIDNIALEIMETGGRFLQQDYRTGDWRRMNMHETENYIRLQLVTGNGSLLAELKNGIDFLFDEYRFGMLRETIMSRASQTYLKKLEIELFGVVDDTKKPVTEMRSSSRCFTRRAVSSESKITVETRDSSMSPSSLKSRNWTAFPKKDSSEIPLFSEVIYWRGEWPISATVVGVSENNSYEIAFYGNEDAYNFGVVRTGIPLEELSRLQPAIEGERAEGNYEAKGNWFLGIVTHVYPGGHVDITYDDGDWEEGLAPGDYFIVEA